jgi:transcriptional regulator with XRE-family HTH domain
MRLGKRIKLARERAEMTASELGKRAGISGMQIGRIERGETITPSLLVIQRIVQQLSDEDLRSHVRDLFI